MNQHTHIKVDGYVYLIADIQQIGETCIVMKGKPDGLRATAAHAQKVANGLAMLGRVLDLDAAPAAGG